MFYNHLIMKANNASPCEAIEQAIAHLDRADVRQILDLHQSAVDLGDMVLGLDLEVQDRALQLRQDCDGRDMEPFTAGAPLEVKKIVSVNGWFMPFVLERQPDWVRPFKDSTIGPFTTRALAGGSFAVRCEGPKTMPHFSPSHDDHDMGLGKAIRLGRTFNSVVPHKFMNFYDLRSSNSYYRNRFLADVLPFALGLVAMVKGEAPSLSLDFSRVGERHASQ
jgi:hypothetical protein